VSELGNLTGGILLSPREMSTVKIRAGSLFCTPSSRTGAWGTAFEQGGFSSIIHSRGRAFTGCTQNFGHWHLQGTAFWCRVG
jgi:hypothetical protein